MALSSQPLTGKPLAELPQLDELREELAKDVPTWELIASIAIGTALVLFGISRRSLWGGLAGLAGAALVARGGMGRWPVYRTQGIDSSDLQAERRIRGHGR